MREISLLRNFVFLSYVLLLDRETSPGRRMLAVVNVGYVSHVPDRGQRHAWQPKCVQYYSVNLTPAKIYLVYLTNVGHLG